MFRSLRGLGPKALVALLLGGALAFVAISQASAANPTLSLGRITVAGDAQVTMDLRALDVGGLGLGAWEIQVHYDTGVVEPVVCSSHPNGKCNGHFAADRVGIVGATARGLTGDITLASIKFRCRDIGQTSLTIVVKVFADATQGEPRPIIVDVHHGAISCVERAPARVNVPGDVNCDGRVTSVDALLVLQFEAGLIRRLPCAKDADLNHDGRINSIDAQFIKKFVAGLLDQPAY